MVRRFFFIAIVLCQTVYSQSADSLCLQLNLVRASFKQYHYSPPEFNNEVYKDIAELFVDEADSRHIFFFKNDYEKLKKKISETDDADILCKLVQDSYELFNSRIKTIDSILLIIENGPLTFSKKDTARFLPSKSKWILCENIKDLQSRILKRIKFDYLSLFIKPLKENEDVTKLAPPEMAVRQTACKKKALQRFRRFLEDFRKEFTLKHHLADAMSNAIALRCDPHSSYFNSYQKEQFEASLSTEELSFGFYADENESGEIIISELLPGGAAWKSSRLHVGDVILSFRFKGEAVVELEFPDIEDFYRQFYKSSARQVEIKIRRKDNQVITVSLQKEKIQSQENVMNSYVLQQGGKKVGYISIPSFYSDDERNGKQGCANDVAKEIVKLKQDSIEGLIIDLRYNGGGSMIEAMDLAGIFIDEGPLSVYKTRFETKPRLLKDLNRGSIYDGPLLVLVNAASASASEFFAATVQDYNRAIIAGSTTFGKGTAQSIFPADTNLYKLKGKRYYINPSLGYTKVTMGKFYRITSKSHQGKGIEPDIAIPDFTQAWYNKESAELFYLPADTVNKKVVYSKLPPLPVEELKKKSSARISGESKFRNIVKLSDSIQTARSKEEKMLITVEDYKQYYDRNMQLNERIDSSLERSVEGYSVKINSFSDELTAIDEYRKKTNEATIEDLKTDIILQEAFYILSDLLSNPK